MLLLPLAGGAGGAASMPDMRLEIALASTPGATPVWTDVTNDLRSLSTHRGRSSTLDQHQAGRMSVVLDNRARAYDPTVVATIRPRKRIRFVADGQVQFDGYVDSWGLEYDKPNESRVIVSATDGFKVLAGAKLPSSVYALEVLADNPVAWWRLNEGAGSTTVRDEVEHRPFEVVGTGITLGAAGLVARDAGTALSSPGGETSHLKLGTGGSPLPTVGTGSFTIEFLYQGTESDPLASPTIFSQLAEVSGFESVYVSLFTSGAIGFAVSEGLGATDNAVGATDITDGLIHHVACVYESGSAVRIYVDGALDGTDAAGARTRTVSASYAAGDSSLGAGTPSPRGVIDELAFYGSALSATRIAAHNAECRTPWNGDTPGARATRLLDYAEALADDRYLDTGQSVLQSADIGGQSVLEHLQKVAESEFSDTYMTRDGKVRLVERNGLVNRPVYATFGDTGADHRYASIEFDFSDQLIRNDIRIQRDGGPVRSAEDATSLADFQRQTFSRSGLIHNSDDVSHYAAEFLLSEYKDALLRITSITIEPGRSPATLFPEVLGRELGDYVTVKLTPPGGGAQIEQASRIEGISHSVAPKHWRTTWQLSPAYAGTNFFELDDGNGSAPSGLDDAALYF